MQGDGGSIGIFLKRDLLDVVARLALEIEDGLLLGDRRLVDETDVDDLDLERRALVRLGGCVATAAEVVAVELGAQLLREVLGVLDFEHVTGQLAGGGVLEARYRVLRLGEVLGVRVVLRLVALLDARQYAVLVRVGREREVVVRPGELTQERLTSGLQRRREVLVERLRPRSAGPVDAEGLLRLRVGAEVEAHLVDVVVVVQRRRDVALAVRDDPLTGLGLVEVELHVHDRLHRQVGRSLLACDVRRRAGVGDVAVRVLVVEALADGNSPDLGVVLDSHTACARGELLDELPVLVIEDARVEL